MTQSADPLATLIYGVRDLSQDGGATLPRRPQLNVTGATLTDNPSANRTDMAITGSSASPGGSSGALQYNNASAFGGMAEWSYASGGICANASGFLSFGTSPTTAGLLRLPSTPGDVIDGVYVGGGAGQVATLLYYNNNVVQIGCDGSFASTKMCDAIYVCAISGVDFFVGSGGANAFAYTAAGVSFTLPILNGPNPIIGNSAANSPYGVHGSVVINLTTATHTCTAAEYANGEIHVTGTGANVIKFPPVTSDANTYSKYIYNGGTGTLAVQDTSSHAAAATLAAGAGAFFRFGNGTVKQMTAAFTVA